MANSDFNAKKHIKAVQEEIIEIVDRYGGSKEKDMAIASAFLGVVVPTYEEVLGTEGACIMMYKVSDELALRVPNKVKIPATNFSSRKFNPKANRKRKT